MSNKSKLNPAIRRLLNRFEKAVEAKAWKGSNPPDEWEAIEDEYTMAKDRLIDMIIAHQK